MTIMQFQAKMLLLSTQQAELLCELTMLEEIKIKPEQIRKNVATILSLLTETETFLEVLSKDICSSSDNNRIDKINSVF